MRTKASASTRIQMLFSHQHRGRIIAFYSVTIVGIGAFASLLVGALPGSTGARLTVVRRGALCLAAALLFQACVRPFARFSRRGEKE